jgi:uncharacterized protein YjbJ (UPF0337 family)
MNWDRVQGNWKQMTGKVKEKWGNLTDDDLTQINGNREQLEGKIQARYGYAKDKVKQEVDDWLSKSWLQVLSHDGGASRLSRPSRIAAGTL